MGSERKRSGQPDSRDYLIKKLRLESEEGHQVGTRYSLGTVACNDLRRLTELVMVCGHPLALTQSALGLAGRGHSNRLGSGYLKHVARKSSVETKASDEVEKTRPRPPRGGAGWFEAGWFEAERGRGAAGPRGATLAERDAALLAIVSAGR